MSVIVIAAANEDAAAEGNLSDRQVLVHIGNPGSETPVFVPEVAAGEFDELSAAVEGWASTLAEPTIVPLEVAIDPTMTERSDGQVQHPTVILGVPVDEDTYRDSGLDLRRDASVTRVPLDRRHDDRRGHGRTDLAAW